MGVIYLRLDVFEAVEKHIDNIIDIDQLLRTLGVSECANQKSMPNVVVDLLDYLKESLEVSQSVNEIFHEENISELKPFYSEKTEG
jgi:hypothetical protein